ncbi:hypothetical protein HDV00_003739 [Rhizophlyctis rosea]|nr:hypothetical protein HDV00_003739 [Rhizophlyctis rosea]
MHTPPDAESGETSPAEKKEEDEGEPAATSTKTPDVEAVDIAQWPLFSPNESEALNSRWEPKSVVDEAQGLGHGLNPDAPEFAPTFEAEARRLGLNLPQDARERPADATAEARDQNPGLRHVGEQGRLRQEDPREQDLTPHMNVHNSELDAGDRRQHLRRTGSEPSIAPRLTAISPETMGQVGWPEASSTRPVHQFAQPASAPIHRVQQPITPGPSPRRRPSIPREHTSQNPALEAIAGEGLVIRTRTLLEHQMRANLLFAEQVAQEYGRELAVRVEAQRRAFVAEEGRRVQLIEMAFRRKLAENEENLRRQYEEPEMNRVRILEARNAELERVADELQRAMQMDEHDGPMDPIALQHQHQQRAAVAHWRNNELVRQIEQLRHEVELREQAVKRAQQEAIRVRDEARAAMSESTGTSDALARAFSEEREKRLRLEQRVNGLQERNALLEDRVRNSSISDNARNYSAELNQLSEKSPDELRMLVITLDRERQQLANDNLSIQRRVADMNADLDSKIDEANDLREQMQQKEGGGRAVHWIQGLQADIQQLETAAKSPGPAKREVQDRVVNMLREVEKQQQRLQDLLPEPPAWETFDGNTDALLGGELESGSTSSTKEREWQPGQFFEGQPITPGVTPGTPGSVGSFARSDGYFGSMASNAAVGSGRVRTKSGGEDAGGFAIEGPRIAGIVPLKDPAPGSKDDSAERAPMSFYDRFMAGSFLPTSDFKPAESSFRQQEGGDHAASRESTNASSTNSIGTNNNNIGNNGNGGTFLESMSSQSDSRSFPAASIPTSPPHPSWFGYPHDLKLTGFGPSTSAVNPSMALRISSPAPEARSIGMAVTSTPQQQQQQQQQPHQLTPTTGFGTAVMNPQPFAVMGRTAFRPHLPGPEPRGGGGNGGVGGGGGAGVGVIGGGMRHGQGGLNDGGMGVGGEHNGVGGGGMMGLGMGIGMNAGPGGAGGGGFGMGGGGGGGGGAAGPTSGMAAHHLGGMPQGLMMMQGMPQQGLGMQQQQQQQQGQPQGFAAARFAPIGRPVGRGGRVGP